MTPTNGASSTVRRPYREAPKYYEARPPYSAVLRPALSNKLGWDGTGRLLDIGCGPRVIALELAPSFRQVVGLDPEEPDPWDVQALAQAAQQPGEPPINHIESRNDDTNDEAEVDVGDAAARAPDAPGRQVRSRLPHLR